MRRMWGGSTLNDKSSRDMPPPVQATNLSHDCFQHFNITFCSTTLLLPNYFLILPLNLVDARCFVVGLESENRVIPPCKVQGQIDRMFRE